MSKIVHLCLACFFPDGYSYQENLLPKFHKKMGFDVEVIASPLTFGAHGEQAYTDAPRTYYNENGIRVTRLPYKKDGYIYKKLAVFSGVFDALCAAKPEILFIHGCQFLSIKDVVDYLKLNPTVRVFVDNHADYSNSARGFVSKHFLHRLIWKYCAQLIDPYCCLFWGVLPARVDFLIENYGLSKSKCKLLVMGGDDEEIDRASDPKLISEIRSKLNCSDDELLIVTGGKIDSSKTEVFNLMRAVGSLKEEGWSSLQLLVFGPVSSELEQTFNEIRKDTGCLYIPWANSSESYNLFAAADLVVFPGRHSVYWEQVASLGKPMLVKLWEGTDHIDVWGNVVLMDNVEVDSLKSYLRHAFQPDVYDGMTKAAHECASLFRYSEIARRSVACDS